MQLAPSHQLQKAIAIHTHQGRLRLRTARLKCLLARRQDLQLSLQASPVRGHGTILRSGLSHDYNIRVSTAPGTTHHHAQHSRLTRSPRPHAGTQPRPPASSARSPARPSVPGPPALPPTAVPAAPQAARAGTSSAARSGVGGASIPSVAAPPPQWRANNGRAAPAGAAAQTVSQSQRRFSRESRLGVSREDSYSEGVEPLRRRVGSLSCSRGGGCLPSSGESVRGRVGSRDWREPGVSEDPSTAQAPSTRNVSPVVQGGGGECPVFLGTGRPCVAWDREVAVTTPGCCACPSPSSPSAPQPRWAPPNVRLAGSRRVSPSADSAPSEPRWARPPIQSMARMVFLSFSD